MREVVPVRLLEGFENVRSVSEGVAGLAARNNGKVPGIVVTREHVRKSAQRVVVRSVVGHHGEGQTPDLERNRSRWVALLILVVDKLGGVDVMPSSNLFLDSLIGKGAEDGLDGEHAHPGRVAGVDVEDTGRTGIEEGVVVLGSLREQGHREATEREHTDKGGVEVASTPLIVLRTVEKIVMGENLEELRKVFGRFPDDDLNLPPIRQIRQAWPCQPPLEEASPQW